MNAIEKKWAAKALAAEQRNRDEILDLPEMDGISWIPSLEITQPMLDAWPIWEERFEDRIQPLLLRDISQSREGSSFRPLRLPSMDESGVIKVSDMTPEHFERVKDWQVWEMMNAIWPSRWVVATGASFDSMRGYEFWRPAVFARLDDRVIEPELACNCDQALTAERDRDALQCKVKDMAAEIRKLRLALISQSADTVHAKASLKAFEQRLADVKDRAGEATRSV